MKILLFLLLLLLPLQLGKHFWPDYSYVLGLKVDYLAVTIYLQDFLTAFLIILYFSKLRSLVLKHKIITIGLIIFEVINVVSSTNPVASLIAWLRVMELFLLAIIISQNKEFVWKSLQTIIPFWLFGEFSLGLIQILKQSSVGGIFWWLGERSFNILTPGIARAQWLGEVFLRPYGTFSHPNSLAGFLLVSMILLIGFGKNSWHKVVGLVYGFLLLFLCFSRTIWLTMFLLAFFYVLNRLYFYLREKRKFDYLYYCALGIVTISVFLFSKTRIQEASFEKRTILSIYALKIVQKHPLIGIGLNNFIPSLASSDLSWQMISFLQPVHNIFLLIGSELGIVGLMFFLVFLLLAIRRLFQFKVQSSKFKVFVALCAILFTGLFDHYWLTLYQNQLLFTVVLGLAWQEENGRIKK